MIKVDDGDEQSFAGDESSEVLYQNTGLSRYFVRNFSVNILNYNSYADIEKEDQVEMDRDKGILRRQRVYRRLLMSPVVYNEGPEDSDYGYIKNFRNVIENDFEKFLELPVHVHKNGAMLVLPESHIFKDTFPDSRTLSEIVLQMNLMIQEAFRAGELHPEKDDTMTVSRTGFESMIKRLKEENDIGWSKEYREMSFERLTEDILAYMNSFQMIELMNRGREIRILPLAGKLAGKYPWEFTELTQGQKEMAAAHEQQQ
jgi:uncharacterized protein (TIGR02678 family)